MPKKIKDANMGLEYSINPFSWFGDGGGRHGGWWRIVNESRCGGLYGIDQYNKKGQGRKRI